MSVTTNYRYEAEDGTLKALGKRTSSNDRLLHFGTSQRKDLKDSLLIYTTETLDQIMTVIGFDVMVSEWSAEREEEFRKIKDIKNRLDKLKVEQNIFLRLDIPRKQSNLRTELAAELNGTLEGLKELSDFLDALKKLAVTSLHVFTEDEKIRFQLPRGVGLVDVQEVIRAARSICPLILVFKEYATSAYFQPKLRNLEEILNQLGEYISTTKEICDHLQISHLPLEMSTPTEVEIDDDLLAEDGETMLRHIKELHDIREDEHFWMVFLFQGVSESEFVSEYGDRKDGMEELTKTLEEIAAQLDSMNKGARISSVVGSSVGAIGSVLSIVGLALTPVTLGASLALTGTGLGLIATSGVNTLVTTATEIGVNRTQEQKAEEIQNSSVEDMMCIHDCLNKVISQQATKLKVGKKDVAERVGRFIYCASALSRGISAVKGISAVAKGSGALSKTAMRSLIGVNTVFLGLDIFFICKDSMHLAGGSEADMSKYLRAIAEEVDSWQKIYESLQSEENRGVLEKQFYPRYEEFLSHYEDERDTSPAANWTFDHIPTYTEKRIRKN